MKWALRIALAMVIVAELNSLWIGFTDRPRFVAVFPAAAGPIFWLLQLTTLAVAIIAALLWIGRRWAIPLNVAIGVWSVVLIRIVGGPLVNQLIVVTACVVTTALSACALRAPA